MRIGDSEHEKTISRDIDSGSDIQPGNYKRICRRPGLPLPRMLTMTGSVILPVQFVPMRMRMETASVIIAV